MAIAPEERIGVEAETRLRDGQATWRRTQRKRDADRTVGSVILLLADTRANRLALKEIRRSVRAELRSTPERCSRALRAGHAPGAGGVVLL